MTKNLPHPELDISLDPLWWNFQVKNGRSLSHLWHCSMGLKIHVCESFKKMIKAQEKAALLQLHNKPALTRPSKTTTRENRKNGSAWTMFLLYQMIKSSTARLYWSKFSPQICQQKMVLHGQCSSSTRWFSSALQGYIDQNFLVESVSIVNLILWKAFLIFSKYYYILHSNNILPTN